MTHVYSYTQDVYADRYRTGSVRGPSSCAQGKIPGKIDTSILGRVRDAFNAAMNTVKQFMNRVKQFVKPDPKDFDPCFSMHNDSINGPGLLSAHPHGVYWRRARW